jgi:hypothetical protein
MMAASLEGINEQTPMGANLVEGGATFAACPRSLRLREWGRA